MSPAWTTDCPRWPGWYLTSVKDEIPHVMAREVYKSHEHGMMVRYDPYRLWLAMSLEHWHATQHPMWAGPYDAPPTEAP